MLISQVHAEIVCAGYDPAIGISHGRHTNPIPLVYDLMEPLRPVIDRKVLEFGGDGVRAAYSAFSVGQE
jgi:CRISPR/Cas system-associated endonuclease Cas1